MALHVTRLATAERLQHGAGGDPVRAQTVLQYRGRSNPALGGVAGSQSIGLWSPDER
jgi:hypothetical protein